MRELAQESDTLLSCGAGAVTRKGSYDHLPRVNEGAESQSSTPASLPLEHAPQLEDLGDDVAGPFDVVVTDVKQSRVCDALIQVGSLLTFTRLHIPFPQVLVVPSSPLNIVQLAHVHCPSPLGARIQV